ncbi:MAG: S41 family peptidase, partial [Anaerolineales bacterium]
GQAYQGIGAFVAFRNEPAPHLVLLEVMAESPAEYAGLQDRDSIFAIDGVPTTSEKGISDIQRIRGLAGSTVTLSISSPGGQIRDVVVTRGAINPLPQRIIMNFMTETAVVYSAFPRLGYEGMDIDFLSIYQILAKERDITGLIIDLRISSTGPTWPLSTLLSVFADGTLGHSKKAQEKIAATIIGKDYYGSQSTPVVILIGPETMGQPEIFAASMQYANRAIVLGLPTLGLVEGADIFPMPDGSQLSLATITFITAAGRDLGLEGVEPDMSIDRYWETIDPNNDMIINQALNILQGSE